MSQHYSLPTAERLAFGHAGTIRRWGSAIVLFTVVLSGCTTQPQNGGNIPNPSVSIVASPTITPSPTAISKSQATKDLENRLSKAFTAATKVPMDAVDCPAQFDVRTGNRFNCQATSDGQSFTLVVELTNPDGQFQWNTQGLLVLPKLEQFIQNRIRAKGGPDVTADCGGKIRAAQPGDTFECKVVGSQVQQRSAQVRVKDEQGGVDISLR